MTRDSLPVPAPSRRRLLLTAVLAGAVGRPLRASVPAVWLAQSDTGAAIEEAAAAVRDVLAPAMPVQVAGWAHLTEGPPPLIVTLGVAALRGMLGRRTREPALANVPILAGLLPRQAFEAEVPRGTRGVSAVVLDQPAERYGELIRNALPQFRRVGLLVGSPAAGTVESLQRWALGAGLDLHIEPVRDGGLAPALRRALDAADVLLALPDPAIYRPESLQNILIASYRQRVPVVSYAPAHVAAGAVLALSVTPAQAGRQIGQAAREWVMGRVAPPLTLAQLFTVTINEPVARSLELALPNAGTLEAALTRSSRLEGRP